MALQAAQEAHGLSVVTRVPGRYGGWALAALTACARQSRAAVARRLSLSRGRDDGDHGANVRAG